MQVAGIKIINYLGDQLLQECVVCCRNCTTFVLVFEKTQKDQKREKRDQKHQKGQKRDQKHQNNQKRQNGQIHIQPPK